MNLYKAILLNDGISEMYLIHDAFCFYLILKHKHDNSYYYNWSNTYMIYMSFYVLEFSKLDIKIQNIIKKVTTIDIKTDMSAKDLFNEMVAVILRKRKIDKINNNGII